ncbi:MAG: helix-turn-helix transcriptional regulator [Clostridia bacterium]|nr:helix-turn-helix transcriptional regulator [Clostridia bacterium]
MNEKFFRLPKEKQQRIIDAGFYVFSQTPYRQSPMREIADRATISKALLFFYFRNKKELYLFLWKEAARITVEMLRESECSNQTDLFAIMERGRLSLTVWSISVSLLLGICILIYPEIKAEAEDIGDMFANMGSFSEAFGLDLLNVGYVSVGMALLAVGIGIAFWKYPKKDIQ